MKLKHLSIIALTMASISCQEEKLDQDWTGPNGNDISFRLTVPEEEGSLMIWPSGAKIGVFCEQTGSANVPVEISASTATSEEASFYTGISWGEGQHRLLVYYPYKQEHNGTSLSGNLPQVLQSSGGSASSLASRNLYHAAVDTEPLASGEQINVALDPIFSLCEISLAGTRYEGYTLDQVTVKTKTGKAICGDYTYDLNTSALSFATDASDSLAINVSDMTISAAGNKIFFLNAAPDQLDEEASFTVTISEGEASSILKGTGTLKAQTVLNVDEFKSEEAVDDSYDLSDPDKDGLRETANCYVAGIAGQEYRFPATVMGNGHTTPADNSYAISDGVQGSSPGITPTALAPQSAKLLWQTERDLITNVKLKNGYVYFTLNGEQGGQLTEGNAVIAIFDDAAATGKILWSWHIWVTAADLDAKVQTWKIHPSLEQYSAYVDPQLMDRNLGALSERGWEVNANNLDHGMTYQWGRKDPFISGDDSKWGTTTPRKTYDADNNEIPDYTEAGSAYSSAAAWTYGNQHATKENLADSPMRFYWTGTNKSEQFWLDEICHDLWGCPGYADDSNNIGQKTIYDPCPPGYRVMNAYAMSGAKVSSPVGGDLNKADGEPRIPNAATYGANKEALQVFYDGTNTSYIPLTGMTTFDSNPFRPVYRTGSYGYIWTAKMTSGWTSRAYRIHIDANHFHVGGPKGNGYTSYGHSVRCERIK